MTDTLALTLVMAVVLVAGISAGAVMRVRAVSSSSPPDSDELSFYQLAYLSGGRKRVAETALAFLVWVDILEVRERTHRVVLRTPPASDQPLHPVEIAVLNLVPMDGIAVVIPRNAAAEMATRLVDELSGWLVSRSRLRVIRLVTALPALGVASVAGWWSVTNWGREMPIGLLPVIGLAAVAVLLVSMVDRPVLTSHGVQTLETARAGLDDDLAVASSGVTSLRVERGIYVVALYGRQAMTGGLAGLRKVLGPE